MNCKNCGNYVSENAMFCSTCGAPLNQMSAAWRPDNLQPSIQGQRQGGQWWHTYQPTLPMKWYKFLIYFALFAAAFVSLVNAFSIGSGYFYVIAGRRVGEYVYLAYPALKVLDFIYSILMLGFSFLYLITRKYLARYKVIGIKLLYSTYAITILSSVIYVIVEACIIRFFFAGSFIFQLLADSIGLLLSVIYFNKRKHLFH